LFFKPFELLKYFKRIKVYLLARLILPPIYANGRLISKTPTPLLKRSEDSSQIHLNSSLVHVIINSPIKIKIKIGISASKIIENPERIKHLKCNTNTIPPMTNYFTCPPILNFLFPKRHHPLQCTDVNHLHLFESLTFSFSFLSVSTRRRRPCGCWFSGSVIEGPHTADWTYCTVYCG